MPASVGGQRAGRRAGAGLSPCSACVYAVVFWLFHCVGLVAATLTLRPFLLLGAGGQ